MSNSLQAHGLYSPWNSSGQNTGVGSLSLFQGIFPTQGSNPGLLHCRWIFYQLNHQGSPRVLEWVVCLFSSRSSWSQESNQGLLNCRWILYQLSYQGSATWWRCVRMLLSWPSHFSPFLWHHPFPALKWPVLSNNHRKLLVLGMWHGITKTVLKKKKKKKEKFRGYVWVSDFKYVLCCESESVSHSVVSNSLGPHGLKPIRLLWPWDFPGKNTGVGCHSLLQVILPTQESNPGLLHCRLILYHLSHQGTQISLWRTEKYFKRDSCSRRWPPNSKGQGTRMTTIREDASQTWSTTLSVKKIQRFQ